MSHRLFQRCSEGLWVRLQKPYFAAHHAQMGKVLPLNPKMLRWRAYAQVRSGILNSDWASFAWESSSVRPHALDNREGRIYCTHIAGSERCWAEDRSVCPHLSSGLNLEASFDTFNLLKVLQTRAHLVKLIELSDSAI